MAEDAASMLQPPLHQHGDHGPKGPEGEADAPLRSQVEDKNADSSSCHGNGVCKVMDARRVTVVGTNKDLVIKAFCGQETNQNRPSANFRPYERRWIQPKRDGPSGSEIPVFG